MGLGSPSRDSGPHAWVAYAMQDMSETIMNPFSIQNQNHFPHRELYAVRNPTH